MRRSSLAIKQERVKQLKVIRSVMRAGVLARVIGCSVNQVRYGKGIDRACYRNILKIHRALKRLGAIGDIHV